MGEELSDIDDGDSNNSDDAAEAVSEPSLSDKQQAQIKLESRRRLEQKLEDARVRKQVQEYDFDDDFGGDFE
jgi:hypothetical protein